MAQNNLLAQSALPVGQTPLANIQSPQVGVSLPNPMDVTNFFRMQQGLQGNAGIMQRNEELQLRKQALALDEYKTLLAETDFITNAGNQLFGDMYNQHSRQKAGSQSAGGGLFEGLDPFRAGHERVYKRNQAIYDEAMAKIDALGKQYLSSGLKDPAVRFESVRQMNNIMTDARRKMATDKEYVRFTTMHRAYNQWMDNLEKARQAGKYINNEEVDAMMEKYNAWTNSTQPDLGNVSLADFMVSRYTYDRDGVLKRISDDAKEMAKGVDEFTEIDASGGTKFAGTQTTRRSAEDITKDLTAKYMDDPDARALFNNTVKGKYGFDEWIGAQVSAHVPQAGKEVTVTSKSSSPFLDPNNVTGKRGTTTSTRTGSGGSGSFTGNMYNVLGDNIKDGDERDTNRYGYTLQGRGYDTSRAINLNGQPLGPEDWRRAFEIKKERGEVEEIFTDAKGRRVSEEVATHVEIWAPEVPSDNIDEENKPELFLARMPRIQRVNGTGDDLGFRNKNPGNVRATDAQIKAGVKTDPAGFIIFDSFEEGSLANLNDIKAKVNGRSSAMKSSPWMINKYGEEKLSNYQDFATVEDLLNVRTPQTTYGGDNKPVEVANFLDHLEKRGYARDTKLKDVEDLEGLNKAMIEFESPNSFNALYKTKADITGKADSPIDQVGVQRTPAEVEMANIESNIQPVEAKVINSLRPGYPFSDIEGDGVTDLTPQEMVDYLDENDVIPSSRDYVGVRNLKSDLLKNGRELDGLYAKRDDLERRLKKYNMDREFAGKSIITIDDDVNEILKREGTAPGFLRDLQKTNEKVAKFEAEREGLVGSIMDSDTIKSHILHRSIPQFADESYELMTDELMETSGGEFVTDAGKEVFIKRSVADPDRFFIQEEGKGRIVVDRAGLKEYVADNLKNQSFDNYNPVDIMDDHVRDLNDAIPAQRQALIDQGVGVKANNQTGRRNNDIGGFGALNNQ